jgi:DNA-binding transcriptional LysR family regulator
MDTLTRMKAFIEVVDNGGYSAAARKIGRSKALLSKYVKELEDDLDTLLVNRTTRQLSLTEAGQTYYDSAVDILQRVEDANDAVRESSKGVKGTLRITAPRSLDAIESVLPIVSFAKAYPEIKLIVDLDDRMVDLVEERYDVAIRGGMLESSSLIARRLTANRIVLCASPDYLEKHGNPEHPSELEGHAAIVDTNWKGRNNWPFVDKSGETFTQSVIAVLEVNAPEMSKRAALAGLGITRVPEFAVLEELAKGRLVSILESFMPPGYDFYAVFAHRRHVSAKVRVFIDFMTDWFKKRDGSTGV